MGLQEQLKTKRTEVQTLANQAKTLYADLEAQGDKATADDRQKLANMIEAGKARRIELEQLETLHETDQKGNGDMPEPHAVERGQGSVERGWKSWGQTVIGSDQYKHAKPRWTEGKLDRTPVMGGIKALYGSTGATGGNVVQNDVQAGVVQLLPQRPLRVVDLVNVVQTSSDTIEYATMDTRTNNAAVVPEYTGGNFGLKPESNVAFNIATAPVKWIATWVAASKQILDDAPRLRDTIDTELDYMVRITLENQILAGDGIGNNFTGMLNWSGIQTRTMHATTPVGRGQTTGDSRANTLRRAITDIALEFYEATGIVMNPADTENLEITEYNGNRYANAYDPVTMRIWRVPVVETVAIPALTALVGNFRLAATLWDRQQIEILTGQPNDFFLRNAWAILAELRAAFAVQRPKALEKVTLI